MWIDVFVWETREAEPRRTLNACLGVCESVQTSEYGSELVRVGYMTMRKQPRGRLGPGCVEKQLSEDWKRTRRSICSSSLRPEVRVIICTQEKKRPDKPLAEFIVMKTGMLSFVAITLKIKYSRFPQLNVQRSTPSERYHRTPSSQWQAWLRHVTYHSVCFFGIYLVFLFLFVHFTRC